MASNGFAEAFARLSTSDSRLDALKALAKELTPYEWRFVQSLTSTRTFQFDIVGRLPVELVSQIFSYLDTSTPWRLQHVSRAWYITLRSMDVLKPGLESWHDGTPNFQGANLEFCRRKARSIHAFRSGLASPDSSLMITAQDNGLIRPFLAGNNLIWLTRHMRQVKVLNLGTLKLKCFVDPGRRVVGKLFAGDELVVFVASSKAVVFVGDLNGQGSLKTFRVPSSSSIVGLTCRRRTVACSLHSDDYTLVYIWDYDTQQGRSFHISRAALNIPMSRSNLGLLLQPDTETIILCQWDYSTSELDASRTRLLHWRFRYTGKCLYGVRDSLTCYDREWTRASTDGHEDIDFIPASHSGLYLLQSNACRTVKDSAVVSLQFDERLEAFTIPGLPRAQLVGPWEGGKVVWWKDTFVEAGTEEHIVIHRSSISASHLDPATAHDPMNAVLTSPMTSRVGWNDILINDRYIVRSYRERFYVFCYDHTVQLPGVKGILEGGERWEAIEARIPTVSECNRHIEQ